MPKDGMHLWIVNHTANHPSLPGGTRHYELARRLVQRGFDVSIVTSSFHHRTHAYARRFDGHSRVESKDGVRFVWVRSRIGYENNGIKRMLNMAEFALETWRLGRRCFGHSIPRPDVILGSSPDLLAAAAAHYLARHFRVPNVFEIRDVWPETLVAIGGFRASHPLIRMLEILEKFLYRHAEGIISLLPEAWRRVEETGVSCRKVVWISNGASIEDFANTSPAIVSEDRFRLLYLGSHGRANVLDQLLTAAKLVMWDHPHVEIVLVGHGTEKRRLESRAIQEEITNVVFEPPIPKDDIPGVLAAADASIALLKNTPLYRYGVSLNKLFDYMAAGKPILLVGCVAHNYVDLANCGVTATQLTPDTIAEGIRQLARMPREERVAMGLRGQAYLHKHHDWDVLADRLASFLSDVNAGSWCADTNDESG